MRELKQAVKRFYLYRRRPVVQQNVLYIIYVCVPIKVKLFAKLQREHYDLIYFLTYLKCCM